MCVMLVFGVVLQIKLYDELRSFRSVSVSSKSSVTLSLYLENCIVTDFGKFYFHPPFTSLRQKKDLSSFDWIMLVSPNIAQ